MENKKSIRGVQITDAVRKELEDTGRSRVLTFKDRKGKQYMAHIELQDGKMVVVPEGWRSHQNYLQGVLLRTLS